MITELLKSSIEQGALGHQFKSDSRRYKTFVQAIDELSAQLLRDKSAFEADVFDRLQKIRLGLQIQIDVIEDTFNDKS